MHAFRGVISRSQLPLFSSSSSSSSSSLPSSSTSSVGRKTAFVRYQQAKTESESKQGSDQNMEKTTQNPNEKTGDVMSHSFGEGYSTRSDEEGFGGIYGGNQSIPNKHGDDQDSAVEQGNKGTTIHENHPEYDKSQGSEANEKEKARNQRNPC